MVGYAWRAIGPRGLAVHSGRGGGAGMGLLPRHSASSLAIGLRYQRQACVGTMELESLHGSLFHLHILHHADRGDVHGQWILEEERPEIPPRGDHATTQNS